MMDSAASVAPFSPPLTGASIIATPGAPQFFRNFLGHDRIDRAHVNQQLTAAVAFLDATQGRNATCFNVRRVGEHRDDHIHR